MQKRCSLTFQQTIAFDVEDSKQLNLLIVLRIALKNLNTIFLDKFVLILIITLYRIVAFYALYCHLWVLPALNVLPELTYGVLYFKFHCYISTSV